MSHPRQQTYGIESIGDGLLIYRADGTPYLTAKEKAHPTKLYEANIVSGRDPLLIFLS